MHTNLSGFTNILPNKNIKHIDAAKTIDEIGQLIDIPMKDFMMIGSETYYSVKENGDI